MWAGYDHPAAAGRDEFAIATEFAEMCFVSGQARNDDFAGGAESVHFEKRSGIAIGRPKNAATRNRIRGNWKKRFQIHAEARGRPGASKGLADFIVAAAARNGVR